MYPSTKQSNSIVVVLALLAFAETKRETPTAVELGIVGTKSTYVFQKCEHTGGEQVDGMCECTKVVEGMLNLDLDGNNARQMPSPWGAAEVDCRENDKKAARWLPGQCYCRRQLWQEYWTDYWPSGDWKDYAIKSQFPPEATRRQATGHGIKLCSVPCGETKLMPDYFVEAGNGTEELAALEAYVEKEGVAISWHDVTGDTWWHKEETHELARGVAEQRSLFCAADLFVHHKDFVQTDCAKLGRQRIAWLGGERKRKVCAKVLPCVGKDGDRIPEKKMDSKYSGEYVDVATDNVADLAEKIVQAGFTIRSHFGEKDARNIVLSIIKQEMQTFRESTPRDNYMWFSLRSTGAEWGPYPSSAMQGWFQQGVLNLQGDSQVRLSTMPKNEHSPIKVFFPHGDIMEAAFNGEPILGGDGDMSQESAPRDRDIPSFDDLHMQRDEFMFVFWGETN